MKKATFIILFFIPIKIGTYYEIKNQMEGCKKVRIMSERKDKPAFFWNVHWTGVGNLGDFVISNTLQGGIFGRPPIPQCTGPFDGTWNCMMSVGSWAHFFGFTGEFPKGSRQFYIWGCGLWVGAEYPDIKPEGDTVWQKRVCKTGYMSDLGAMAIPELENAGEVGNISEVGMAFSTQIIPYGAGYKNEGEHVFKQPGMAKAEYQTLWPFADTLINKRRKDPTTWLNPAEGDIVSLEDTYAVAGDWIPEKDATVIWVRDTGPYDVWPLGIRVEQRTYSWNYKYNDSYIYINWKIRNMNPFPLRNVYFGYFMDNDVGHPNRPPQGAEDDLIGYDRDIIPGNRKYGLGYTYDADGFEPDWKTPAGYVGCVLLETPGDKGFIGFQYWKKIGDIGEVIDQDGQDSVKYMVLGVKYPERDSFMTAGAPSDMRQLMCSGPYEILKPGEEVDFTVAIVCAYTLDELKEKARYAIKQFESGYLGFSPPPTPKLTVIPGNKKVYLSWSSFPEDYICPMSGRKVFEGYRVYKSRTGLPGEWTLLATYDIKSKTKDTVLVKYSKGTAKATIEFCGFEPDTRTFKTRLRTAEYKITFLSPFKFVIKEKYSNKVYHYDTLAYKTEEKYCIMKVKGNIATIYKENPGYVSGEYIYLDGFYIKIKNGGIDPNQPGIPVNPQAEDEFTIWAYKGEKIGEDKGIQHFYIDEDVTNGVLYYYTVTSFSQPLPELGIESLESGKTGKTYWAIPLDDPCDYEGAKVKWKVEGGVGDNDDVDLQMIVVNPIAVLGDTYEISFISKDTLWRRADYWRLINKNKNKIIIDSCSNFKGDTVPSFDGIGILKFKRKADREAKIDIKNTGWGKKDTTDWKFIIKLNTIRFPYPYYEYDFVITELKNGHTDARGKRCPFKINKVGKDTTQAIFVFHTDVPPIDTLSDGDKIFIYNAITDTIINWRISLEIDAGKIRPAINDTYRIRVFNPLTENEKIKIFTTKYTQKKEKYSLDSVTVVPNPYYIRAPWDESKYKQKIWFMGLPSKCEIRIFNVAGLLVKTIVHNEETHRAMKDRSEYVAPGAHAWDFTSEGGGTVVASGLYIYQVITEDGQQKIGKFAIIR